jgi:hypothetical protein
VARTVEPQVQATDAREGRQVSHGVRLDTVYTRGVSSYIRGRPRETK